MESFVSSTSNLFSNTIFIGSSVVNLLISSSQFVKLLKVDLSFLSYTTIMASAPL